MIGPDKSGSVVIFVDFDGTAAEELASNRLLDRFAQRNWRELDQQLLAGEISLRECVLRQFPMLVGTREEMEDFCRRELRLRPGFKEFVRYCQLQGYETKIASEALDFMIEAMLEREGLSGLPVYADRAVFHSRRLTVELPHFRRDCVCGAGNCKRAHVLADRGRFNFLVYIGDGSNDLCPAREADLVFARRKLAEHCAAEGIDYLPFEDFYEVRKALSRLAP